MAWQFPIQLLPVIGVLLVSMVVSGVVTLYTVVARMDALDEPSVTAFVGLNAGCTVWSGAYAMQLLSADVPSKRAWLGVAFIGAVVVVLSSFSFSIAYSENERWLTRRTVGLLSVEPAVAFVLFATGYRRLYEQPVETVVVADLVVLERSFGPIGVVHVLYLYGLLVVAAGFLVRTVADSRHVYREQAIAVLIAVLVPLVANVVWFLGIGPLGNLDLTPVAFTVTGLAFAVAIYRHHLLDIAPVARTAVVEGMRDGFLVIDDRDRVRDVNAAVRTDVVDGVDAIVGRDVVEVLPEVEPVVRDRRATGQAEIVVDCDDGRRIFDVQVQRLPTDGGFRLLLLRNITRRRAVERRYQSFIEHSSDLITVVDADGIVQYQSPSSAAVLGYEPSSVIGDSYFALVHPEDRDRLRETFRTGVESSTFADRAEYRLRTAGGGWRDVETVGSNLLDDPFVEGVVLNTRDVTERRAQEREIRRKNEQLEQFAGVVSHDLRNPLSVAQGYLEMAEDEVDCEYHADIAAAHDRMETIIEDVLVLAREGKAVGESDRLDLERIVDRAWTAVETADATVTVENDRSVVADEDRLLQLFENLFRNAVEHGGDAVGIRVGATSDGFFVEDDGPGIPVDERDAVLEYGHTTTPTGTGFGLAIVGQIADGHGWSVRVTESADGGARFEFDTEASSSLTASSDRPESSDR